MAEGGVPNTKETAGATEVLYNNKYSIYFPLYAIRGGRPPHVNIITKHPEDNYGYCDDFDIVEEGIWERVAIDDKSDRKICKTDAEVWRLMSRKSESGKNREKKQLTNKN